MAGGGGGERSAILRCGCGWLERPKAGRRISNSDGLLGFKGGPAALTASC